jgi:hypothetical protein
MHVALQQTTTMACASSTWSDQAQIMVAAVLTSVKRAVWAFLRVAACSIVPMFRGWAGPSVFDADCFDDEEEDEEEDDEEDEEEGDEAERQTEAATDAKQQVPFGVNCSTGPPSSDNTCN